MSAPIVVQRKILIVEDERLLNDVYSLVLSKNNYLVQGVYSGLEALDAVPVFKPDLILLDLMMPGMDGVTFLQTFDPLQHQGIKIIVYSNLFDSAKVDLVKHLGASDIVLKSSMTPDQLVRMITFTLTA